MAGVAPALKSQFKALLLRQAELDGVDKRLEVEGYLAGTVNSVCATADGKTIIAIWRQRPRHAKGESIEGGVYRSTDSGETWAKAERGLPEKPPLAYDVIKHPTEDTFYLATETGVYCSEDRGESWKSVTQEPQAHNSAWFVRITLDPVTGGLYAREVNDGYGVHMLPPRAPEWLDIGEGVREYWSADDVAFCPAENTVYVVTGTRGVLMVEPPKNVPRAVYARRVCEDGRIAWREEKGLPVSPDIPTGLAFINPDPNTGEAWAGTFHGFFHKNGGKWECELKIPLVLGAGFEIGGSRRVVAWTMDEFYLRSNGAWKAVPTPWDGPTWIRCAAFCGDRLFMGTNRGLFSTANPLNGEWAKHDGI